MSTIRTEANVRSESTQYNGSTMNLQLVHEEYNTVHNFQTIIRAITDGRAHDLADVKKVEKETPCIILGSGPSLDEILPFLKNWEGGIICTTSHARTLMHFGIEPTHILVLDPFGCWDEIAGIDWSKTKTKLILHPGCQNDLVENWPNEFILYIQNNGVKSSFYATTQKRMYSWKSDNSRTPQFNYYIRTEVVVFACSPPMQMFMADLLGYGNCYLAGVDFGFLNGKDRFTEWEFDADGNWKEVSHPFVQDENQIVGNNGVVTVDIHLYYKKNFFSAWRLSHQTVYSMDKGLMQEIPFLDIEEVIEKKGIFPKQDEEFINTITEKYLASVGAFILHTENAGVSFVETNNPEVDLVAYMIDLQKNYICTKCKSRYTSVPEKGEPIDITCPRCNDKTLIQAIPIDIPKNMERIRNILGTEAPLQLAVHSTTARNRQKRNRQKRKQG